MLSDGRSISRMARCHIVPAELRELSASARSGANGARRALWQILFPGAVGDFLGAAGHRPLVLQFPPDLDPLAWELAAKNDTPMAARWSVTRQVLFDDESSPMAPAPNAHGGLLRVLGVGVERDRLGAHTTNKLLELRSLTAAQWSRQGAEALLAAQDVVFLDAAAATLLPGVWIAADAARRPPLLVLCGAEAVSRLVCVREVARRGGAVLCTTGNVAELADPLLTGLLAGHSVAESVRRMHADAALAHVSRQVVLYGQADIPLFTSRESGPMTGTLRQVTTLSVDLVDSTRLLHDLGEERYSLLLEAFHATCNAIVQRHGGMSDDPQGDDGVMSYFGYPDASESAAEQAVAAAVELGPAVRAIGVRLRIGVATGRVAVWRGQPVGVSIHLAARLQAAAEPGSLLVAESTSALLGKRFELEPTPLLLSLKGIAGPTAAYRVLGRSKATDYPGLESPPTPNTFVGRETELALLTDEWELAQRGRARVMVLVGEAGIGKSRLLTEFRRWLAKSGQASVECRGRADTKDTAFFALTDTLRRFLDLQPSDSAQTQQEKIVRRLPPDLPVGEAVSLVSKLLTLDGPPTDNPQRQRSRTMALLLEWFRSLLLYKPLCLVVEDAHWIDPSTGEFLAQLLTDSGDLPLLVVAAQRTETSIGWRLPLVHQTLELGRLSPVAARWLARKACGERSLPQDVLRLLAARSDGVPLFIEQSVRMALDTGTTASLQSLRLNVPSSLQGLLMARLDRLPEARPVAQLGAALGREFPEALLGAALAHGSTPLSLIELPARLQELEAAGLLARSGGATDPHWTFKHALMRDTAYQSLWESDRRRLHQDVAKVLEQQFPALVARQPELLARHQAAAGLDAQALAQWEVAARRAAADSAHEEAISHIDSALLLLTRQPPGRDRDATELRLVLLLASRCIATEGYGAGRVERLYARASELCGLLDDETALLKVELGLHGWHFARGDLQLAQDIAVRCESKLRASAGSIQRLQGSWALAITQFHRGDSLPAVERMDAVLAAYRVDMHRPGAVQDPGVMCLCYSAWAQWELGHVADALARIARVVELASLLKHRFSLGEAHGFAASVHFFCGDAVTALAHAERAIAICEDSGFAVWLAHALMMRGRLRCDLGAIDKGLADMDEAFAMWVGTGAAVTLPLYLTMRAEGQALAGRPAQGLVLLSEARALIGRTGERYYEAEVQRLTGELSWQEAGCEGAASVVEAESWLRSAQALAQAQHKHSFALRAAQARARIQISQGDAASAHALLQEALAAMPDKSATRDTVSARLMMRRARPTVSIDEEGAS